MSIDPIAVVAFPGISPFHLAVPGMVFGEDRRDDGVPLFDVRICGTQPGEIMTTGGFSVRPRYRLDALTDASTIIIPGWQDPRQMPSASLLTALRTARDRGARLVGLCLGTFVLAAAGVLDERPATTHWRWAEELARTYPRIEVRKHELYVDCGDLVTSAGAAAGIDCCLHLLRKECGTAIVNKVARRLVVPAHREGGQAQYIERPMPKVPGGHDHFSKAMDWAVRHLHEPCPLDEIAARAFTSRRTFTRRVRETTGTSFGAWLMNERLAFCQRLLETSDQSIDEIARAAGFGSAASLRPHFAAAFGVSPTRYRQGFWVGETRAMARPHQAGRPDRRP